MILTDRLSRPILQESRACCGSFTTLWKWRNDRHTKRSFKLTSVHYSNFMVIKMTTAESVEEYVFRADNDLAVCPCFFFSRIIGYLTPKIIYFHCLKKIFSGSKYPKLVLFNFEKRSTAVCFLQKFHCQEDLGPAGRYSLSAPRGAFGSLGVSTFFWPKKRSGHPKTYLFVLIKKNLSGPRYPKYILFYFESRSTAGSWKKKATRFARHPWDFPAR